MKNTFIAVIIFFAANLHAAFISNRYDTNTDAAATALVNAQATASARAVVSTNNTVTPTGGIYTNNGTLVVTNQLLILNSLEPAHSTFLSVDGGYTTWGYFDQDAGGEFYQLVNIAGLSIPAMYFMGLDVPYGLCIAANPGTSQIISVWTAFNDNGLMTNSTYPLGLECFYANEHGQMVWQYPATLMAPAPGTWTTQPFLSWGVINGATNWTGYSFTGTAAALGPLSAAATGVVTPAFSWTQDTNNNLTSASMFGGSILVTNITIISTSTNTIKSPNSSHGNGAVYTNASNGSYISQQSSANFFTNAGGYSYQLVKSGALKWTNSIGFASTNWYDVTGGTNFTDNWTYFYQPTNVSRSIFMGSNAAPFVLISNPITLNTVYSNAFSVILHGRVDYSLTDSAISGAPCIVYTNLTQGWATVLSNNFVLSGVIYSSFLFDLEPMGVILFTNQSSGSASAAISQSKLFYP